VKSRLGSLKVEMKREVTQRGAEGSGRAISLDRIEAEPFSIQDNSRDGLSDGRRERDSTPSDLLTADD
jgi:hypothetical protein